MGHLHKGGKGTCNTKMVLRNLFTVQTDNNNEDTCDSIRVMIVVAKQDKHPFEGTGQCMDKDTDVGKHLMEHFIEYLIETPLTELQPPRSK